MAFDPRNRTEPFMMRVSGIRDLAREVSNKGHAKTSEHPKDYAAL